MSGKKTGPGYSGKKPAKSKYHSKRRKFSEWRSKENKTRVDPGAILFILVLVLAVALFILMNSSYKEYKGQDLEKYLGVAAPKGEN